MEMELERCGPMDIEYVNGVMRHPSIYPMVSDDLCPAAPDFDAAPLLVNGGMVFLKPLVEGFGAGLFLFHPWNSVTCEVHSCVLPGFRGKIAVAASRMAASWMFTNTGCMKLVTHAPAFNRAAYALARRAGFRVEGVNRKSFLKKGVLLDQTLLGLTREDWQGAKEAPLTGCGKSLF